MPLPTGARLAAKVDGVRQVQGVLLIQRVVDGTGLPGVLQLPIRLALAGRFTVPEAEARLADEQSPRALISSRPLVVK